MVCKYCNNKFKTKSIIGHHQKTAKYCLKRFRIKSDPLYICIYCQKSLSQKIDLERHHISCKSSKESDIRVKYEKIITGIKTQLLEQKNMYEQMFIDQRKTIKDLQDNLENIAIKVVSRPANKNTQINYIQQLRPVTDEYLTSNVYNLTIDHIIKDPEGYTEFALEYPPEGSIIVF